MQRVRQPIADQSHRLAHAACDCVDVLADSNCVKAATLADPAANSEHIGDVEPVAIAHARRAQPDRN